LKQNFYHHAIVFLHCQKIYCAHSFEARKTTALQYIAAIQNGVNAIPSLRPVLLLMGLLSQEGPTGGMVEITNRHEDPD